MWYLAVGVRYGFEIPEAADPLLSSGTMGSSNMTDAVVQQVQDDADAVEPYSMHVSSFKHLHETSNC